MSFKDFFVNRLGLMLVVWVMVIVANVVGYGVTIGQAVLSSATVTAPLTSLPIM